MSALDTPTARLIAAARQAVRTWRPARDSEGDGIVGEMMSALRDLDAAYIDEPVGITADIVVVAGARGGSVLNAAFSEWMMGFPPGWTEGVSRTARLRLVGNAVQPQVAEVAFRGLRERLGEARGARV